MFKVILYGVISAALTLVGLVAVGLYVSSDFRERYLEDQESFRQLAERAEREGRKKSV